MSSGRYKSTQNEAMEVKKERTRKKKKKNSRYWPYTYKNKWSNDREKLILELDLVQNVFHTLNFFHKIDRVIGEWANETSLWPYVLRTCCALPITAELRTDGEKKTTNKLHSFLKTNH